MSGFLLGSRNGLITGFIVITGELIMVFFTYSGHLSQLPDVHHSPISLWLTTTMWILIMVVVQYIYMTSLSTALDGALKEVNERKRIEEELTKSESFIKKLFDSSKLPIVVFSEMDLKIVEVNQAAVDTWNLKERNELVGKSILTIASEFQYDGELSEVKLKQFIEDAKHNESYIFEWRNRYTDGKYWDSEANLTSFKEGENWIFQLVLIDVSDKKHFNLALQKLSTDFASLEGVDFFEAICKHISITVGLDYVYVGKYITSDHSVEVLGGFALGKPMGDFKYYLKDTPCGDVMDSQICIYPNEIQPLFPKDKLLEDMKISGYIGIPIYDKERKPIGIMVALNMSPIVNSDKIFHYLSVFLDRISSEFQRLDIHNKLINEIDYRRRIEHDLRENESRLQSISNNLKTGLIYQIIVYPDGKRTFTYLSQSSKELFGIEPEKGLEDSTLIYERILEEDKVILAQAEAEAIRTFSAFSCEVRVDTPSGIEWISLSSSPTFIERDTIRWDGFGIIVSARKEAEASVRLMAEQLKANIDNTPNVALQWYNEEGKVLLWNNASQSIFGFSSEEAVGKTLDQLIHTPEETQEFLKVIQQIKNTGKPHGPYEAKVKIKDGSQKITLATVFSFPFRKGTMAYACMDVDITTQKQAEKELFLRKEQFKKLIKFSPYPIVLSDFNGNFVLVNDEFLTLTNSTEIEATESNVWDYQFEIPDTNLMQLIDSLKEATHTINNIDIKLYIEKKRTYDLLLSARTVEWNNQDHVLLVLVDITEKKGLENELLKYREHLEQLVIERTNELVKSNEQLLKTNIELAKQREEIAIVLNKLQDAQNKLIQSEKLSSLGLLASGIAHEINNPLNFISGGITGIESSLENDLEKAQEVAPFLQAIHVGVERAAEIVKSLSHYNRKEDIPMELCDVNTILSNCLTMLKGEIKNRVIINFDKKDANCIVFGNDGKLHQAFLNILTNSVQSIKGEGTVSISTFVKNKKINVIISDTGEGISKENIGRLYDPFFTTKAPGEGTGLGLSITLNIIQEHQGTIKHESILQKGTTVTIKLPKA